VIGVVVATAVSLTGCATAPVNPLQIPGSPTARAGVQSVTITWQAAKGPVASYQVHMVGAGNRTCLSSTSCTWPGLAAGHPYAFMVSAVGPDGTVGPWTGRSNVAVPAAPGTKPPTNPTPPPTTPPSTPPPAGGGAITPDTLPANAGSMWQTNDAVWALAISNHVLYAGGDFTAIRPPGAAKGINETTMWRLAAFHADGPDVGQPCSTASPCPGIGAWKSPAIDGRVYALNISPDGKTLYAGGDFLWAGGTSHQKAAAFNISAAGAPVLPWNPQIAGGSVRAIQSTPSAIYVAGAFATAGGANQPRAAAYDANSYARIPAFAPAIDSSVFALLALPGNRLVLGGHFRNVNGQAHSGIAQVDLATGKANGPMSNSIIPNDSAIHYSDVKTLITDGTYIYLGAEGTGRGIFDGQASVDPNTGNIVWKNNCLGATQALALIGNALYIGSHSHDCSSLPTGGFPQYPYDNGPKSWHHLLAQQAVATSGVPNSGGRLLTWYPVLNPGPTNAASPNELGPRALATDGTTLFVGGQQTKVNGAPQQGLTRFSPGGNGLPPTAPAAVATNPGTNVNTIRFTSSSDPDDQLLSYRITRSDGRVVYTVDNQTAPWWANKSYVYRDRGAPAGSTYTVTAIDSKGRTASTSVTPTRVNGGFPAAVLADHPSLYWRFGETSGTLAEDSSGHNVTGTFRGANTLNKAGAIDGNVAVGENGAITTTVSQNGALSAPPKNFSLEAWFRTTSTTGGRIIGWSNAATGSSAHPDRTIYMSKTGQLLYTTFQTTSDPSKQCANGNVFYVKNACYAWGKQEYNDGGWHHVVATQSDTAGMNLYVDGQLIASMPLGTAPATTAGLWRVGGDSVLPFPLHGSTSGWNGDIDEVAVYPTVLSSAQVLAHYEAGN
jgi:hypothetical protein